MPLYIFPSTDLHLLAGATVPLQVFGSIGGQWTDASAIGGYTLGMFGVPAAIATRAGTTIQAQGVGIAHATLRVHWGLPPDPFTDLNVALRITVHHRLRRIVMPTAAFTVEADRTDRILSVYAQFETAGGVQSTHDVTRLPYSRYAVAVTSGSPKVTVDATGRVSSGPTAGSVRITVTADPAVAPAALPEIVDVHVVDAPTDRAILERVHTGTAIRRRSIVVLSEGFTQQQKPAFESLARMIVRRMVKNLSPYDIVRESFDLYTAFVPSQDDGVTFAPPIVAVGTTGNVAVPVTPDQPLGPTDFFVDPLLQVLGHPSGNPIAFAAARTAMNAVDNQFTLTQTTFDVWRALATTPAEPRVRETYFGFMMGERHHSASADPVTVAPASPPTIADVPLDFLRPREDNRTPLRDDHRLPDLAVAGADPDVVYLAQQDRFMQTLRVPGGPQHIGATWAQNGEDFGLVVYLINSDHYGGSRIRRHSAVSRMSTEVAPTRPPMPMRSRSSKKDRKRRRSRTPVLWPPGQRSSRVDSSGTGSGSTRRLMSR